jgi:hypothetical protein
MPDHVPKPLSAAELRARQRRVQRLARQFGIEGRVEYRHVRSRSGGAQYFSGPTAESDLLTVYTEAFERDADPEDFSLEAILAHERGHQLLVRHPRLARLVPKPMSLTTEEILSSLLGSLLVEHPKDKQDMMMKALAEAAQTGRDLNQLRAEFEELRTMMEKIL